MVFAVRSGPVRGSLIEWVFGVVYHKAHVARLLKQVGWTSQKPLERAAQQDEARIAYWRATVWEELKKRLSESGGPWSLWMKVVSICCPRWCEPMLPLENLPCCAQS